MEYKKQTLCRDVPTLDHDSIYEIAMMIHRESSKSLIQNTDGVRCDLDNLSKELITEIFNFVKYKKSK